MTLRLLVRSCAAVVSLGLAGCSDDEPARTNPDAGAEGGGGAPGTGASWASLGPDDDNSRRAANETILGPDNVAGLKPKWLVLDVETGVTSTPVVVDGVVYFGEWGGTVRAVRAEDGAELWRAETEQGFEPNATPLVKDDKVFMTAGSKIFAFAREDGRRLWDVRTDEAPTIYMWGSPRWVDGMVVTGVSSFGVGLPSPHVFQGSVVAYDPDDGSEIWRVSVAPGDTLGVSVWSSAAVDTERKLMYIGTGQSYEQPASPYSDAVVAIDYEKGEMAWHRQYTEGDAYNFFDEAGPDFDIGASPNLFTDSNGRDLVGVGSKGGMYKALDRDDGEVVWETQVGRGSAIGGIMTTAAVDDELIYVSSNDFGNADGIGVTKALGIDDGEPVWESRFDSTIYGALTVANGVVYQPTTAGVAYALNAADGEKLWSVDLEADLGGGFSVVDGVLYVPRGFFFITTQFENAGGLVAFSLDGTEELDFSGGSSMMPDAGTVTVAECLMRTGPGQSQACKDCACACDAAAAASCDDSCWQLAQCVVDNCGTQDFSTDAALACVEAACSDVKLLPQAIQQAINATAPCMVQCQSDC